MDIKTFNHGYNITLPDNDSLRQAFDAAESRHYQDNSMMKLSNATLQRRKLDVINHCLEEL